jgi:primosomal protein N' (replication factor Y)
VPIATDRPVAQVILDSSLPHLDRLFDYGVPESVSATAQPGVRVSVRFAGADHTGFIVARSSASEHAGPLRPLRRVVSPEPVLTPDVWSLVEATASRYAGTRPDVLRLAIPPRHACAERDGTDGTGAEKGGEASSSGTTPVDVTGMALYAGGPAFLRRVAAGEGPRAAWLALPWGGRGGTSGWLAGLVAAVAAARSGGRGALVVVPDARDVRELAEAIAGTLRDQAVACLQAEAGPEARYREFLRVLRGEARIAVGTRAAAFAPVDNLGLVAIWDDGAPTHRDQRAPYPHAREVLALRAAQCGAALMIGSLGRTAATQALVEAGWVKELAPLRADRRLWAPAVAAPSEDDLAADEAPGARIPHLAFRVLTRGLDRGPVLVHVARGGYLPGLACAACRAPALCVACHGPLGSDAAQRVTCGWCARPEPTFACPRCAGTRIRARAVGSRRTAEELGRAFPDVAIVQSSADGPRGVLDRVSSRPALVVATPGAEPIADGGYAAAALLDGWAAGGVGSLDGGVDALTRWLNAAALVRSARDGGEVILVGGPDPVAAQALVRWDPAGYAGRDLAERHALGFPPAVRMARVSGSREAVTAFMEAMSLPAGADVLGPMADGDQDRFLVRMSATCTRDLVDALLAARVAHSARRGPAVRVQVDPPL